MSSILNIAFYKFVAIRSPAELRAPMRELCERLELKGTVILSPEGINGFLAGTEANVRACLRALRSRDEFSDLVAKESWSVLVPFEKLKIKLKREIIPLASPENEWRQRRLRNCSMKKRKWSCSTRETVTRSKRAPLRVRSISESILFEISAPRFHALPQK
jgi:predicted sulfurtransferase